MGWQVFPEFAVTQGEKSRNALEELYSYFDCGHIVINRRNDNHREHLYRYVVRNMEDLQTIILPFFITHPLRTAKRKDFELFVQILELISKKNHLKKEGLIHIAQLVSSMNRQSKSKFLTESSETTR